MTRFDLISAAGGVATAIAMFFPSDGLAASPSTQQSFTIANAGTFSTPIANMGTMSARLGCTIYNLSADMMWVYFGTNQPPALGVTGNSIPLPPGGNLPCNSGTVVPSDAISITSTTLNGATGVFISQ